MKIIMRLLSVILAVLLSLSCIGFVFAEEADTTDSVEVCLLIDCSGSMKTYDPKKQVLDAVHSFASYHVSDSVSDTAFYLHIIPYSSDVHTAFNEIDVKSNKSTNGMALIGDYLEYMRQEYIPDSDFHFNYATDIGSALEAAYEKLAASRHNSKKAVVLFTDGKIEALNDAPNKEQLEAQSKEKAIVNRDKMAAAGITLYSVGLNYKGALGSAQKELLSELSGDKNYAIVSNAKDVSDFFSKIFTYLFPGTFGQKGGEFEIIPSVPSSRKIRMYGDAVIEANISIESDAKLHTIKVITPSGVTVANVDLRDPSKSTINTTYCNVYYFKGGSTATVKLLNPSDGDWEISVTGDAGSAIERRLVAFKTKLYDTLSVDKIYIDDGLQYSALIYSTDTNTHLTSSALYSAEEGGGAYVEIENTSTGECQIFNGVLNANGTEYNFDLDFYTPGEYIVRTMIVHSLFEVKGEKTVSVVGPELKMELSDSGNEYQPAISAYLINPITNQKVNAPGFLRAYKLNTTLYRGEEEISKDSMNLNEMSGFTVYPVTSAGQYKVVYSITSNGTIYDDESVSFTIGYPEMVMDLSLGADKSSVDVSLGFVNKNNEKLTYVPEVYSDCEVYLTFSDGNQIDETKLDLNGFEEGAFKESFSAEMAGTYSVTAQILLNGEVISNVSGQVTVDPSKITANESDISFSSKGFSGSWEKNLDLKDVFEDSDGDELTYQVEVSDDSVFTVDISKKGVLSVVANGFGSETAKLIVTDGKGAEYICEISLVSESLMPLLIGIGIGVAVLIVLLIVFAIIVKKKSIISFSFKIRIEPMDEDFGTFNDYSVGNYSMRKNAKPLVSLRALFNCSNLVTPNEIQMDDARFEEFLSQYGDSIKLKGVPFKKAFNVIYFDQKTKKTTKKLFSKSNVTITVGDKAFRVGFRRR